MPAHRVVVVSIPKSGTYLVAELLKALGYRWTGMHLAETAYTDYSGSQLQEARENPGRFARSEPLSVSLTRIHAGEFAVGHLPFKPEVVEAVRPFKRLFVTRDLRSALISYMRFMQTTGRLGAPHLAWYSIPDLRQRCQVFLRTSASYMLHRFYEGMIGWSNLDGTLHVRFEELTDDTSQGVGTIESAATFLGVPNCDARAILRTSLSRETITKSDGLTRLEDYWSDEAEKRFIEIGGVELNARLGCAPSASVSGTTRRVA
ncbi:MAG TPA: sulfotransferase domain-containing protein [Planctomycetaceae bacterium]|nr:sulfotransferase domain-containing protein [Planctomycetaceae bacterium]